MTMELIYMQKIVKQGFLIIFAKLKVILNI